MGKKIQRKTKGGDRSKDESNRNEMIGKDNRVMVKTIMKIRSWNRRDNSYPGIQRNEIRVCDSSRRKVNARRLLRRSLPFGKRKEAAKLAEVVTGVGVLGEAPLSQ